MNKLYKVIWNTSKRAWVAVSELASGRSKSSKTVRIGGNLLNLNSFFKLTALNAALFIPSIGMAADTHAYAIIAGTVNDSNNNTAMAIGEGSEVKEADSKYGHYSSAIGTNATANGPSVTTNGIDAAGTKIANIEDGLVSADSKDAVNGSQLYATDQKIADLTNEVNKGWSIEAGTVEGSTGTVTTAGASNVAAGGTVSVKAGNNIHITQNGNEVAIAASDKPSYSSVETETVTIKDSNNNGVATISAATAEDGVSEVSVAGNTVNGSTASRVTNVAAGKNATDAVNVAQLKGVVDGLSGNINAVNNKVDKVDKNLRAGIAGALATGNLYHATKPGKSMISAGVGNYKGQSAVAVGYSRLSDNGKVGLKLSVNTNTRGDTGAAASIGYQW